MVIQFSIEPLLLVMQMAKAVDVKKEIEELASLMDNVVSDNSVPRNIRNSVAEARQKVLEKSDDKGVSIGSAIYVLDDISSDINMPSHTRTEIWTIISKLEAVKEKLK
jgi:uncharacterized protein (UPF0147 family)